MCTRHASKLQSVREGQARMKGGHLTKMSLPPSSTNSVEVLSLGRGEVNEKAPAGGRTVGNCGVELVPVSFDRCQTLGRLNCLLDNHLRHVTTSCCCNATG
jgi:hypothetical protein